MVRMFALLFVLLLSGAATAADTLPGLSPDPGPLVCRPAAAQEARCGGTLQLAAANCSQTCYDDQNVCRQGCDKAYPGGASGHDKCVAACSTTYGRCQTRCSGR